MFIVWSGWGLLVPLFNFVGLMALVATAAALQSMMGAAGLGFRVAEGIAAVFWAGMTAAAIFVAVEKLERQATDRVLVDEATGERIIVRKTAGSFFFIPTRYWTYCTLVVWALLLVVVATTPPVCTAPGQTGCTAAPAVIAPTSGTPT